MTDSAETIESEIIAAEERLRVAMLGSDVNILDELLADDLIFTNHLGQLMSKQDDLTAHRSGLVTIETLTLSERRVLIAGDAAIVSALVHISGTFAGNSSAADFRFTRLWARSAAGGYQVAAAHSTLVTD